MIISWRIMYLLQLGRTDKNIPADIVLNEDKLDVLRVVGKVQYNQDIDNIDNANNVIGKIGGYTNQKDSRLGYEIFGRGCITVESMTEFYRCLINVLPNRLGEFIKSYIQGGDAGLIKILESYCNELHVLNFVT